jgi:indolepyruvate ferredoxin oxidoreductase alpha subunit
MKELLSGNEAIARGAYEAGVTFASAYPGTPSTEILETVAKKYPEIYAEWSPNEKVALEVAMGAAFTGARALATMKHVGVNVAADPLMTLSYTGICGGLVLVTADDPQLYSSQNEQDNRNYAKFAKIPMLEPSDSQEAKDFVLKGFEISEQFDAPVMLRSVTRISHSRTPVEFRDRQKAPQEIKVRKDPPKYVMLPVYGRKRHVVVEDRLLKLKEFAETFEENRIEMNDPEVGIITSGISYQYAKEVFPEASFLKLGMVWPLPEKKIKEFRSKVKKLYVIEELDPFIEDNLILMGIQVDKGKEITPLCGELTPVILEEKLKGASAEPFLANPENIPPRPPNMCPGCPHRGMFYTIKKLKLFAAGDIGCYTLGALPPLTSLDTCVCMGASIGHAMGMSKALGKEGKGKFVAVIGDSTFMHSGMTGLANVVYNKSYATVIIADNRITAMTGAQDHPATGYTIRGEETHAVDFVELGKALGFKNVVKANPYDLEEYEKILKAEVEKDEPSLIVNQGPCALLKRAIPEAKKPYTIDTDKCIGCKRCLGLGCPAITWHAEEGTNAEGKKRKGYATIESTICNGCGLCYQVCNVDAIGTDEKVFYGLVENL